MVHRNRQRLFIQRILWISLRYGSAPSFLALIYIQRDIRRIIFVFADRVYVLVEEFVYTDLTRFVRDGSLLCLLSLLLLLKRLTVLRFRN